MSERLLLDIPGGMLDLTGWSTEQLAAAQIAIGQAQLARATGDCVETPAQESTPGPPQPSPDDPVPEVRLQGQILNVDGVTVSLSKAQARIVGWVLGYERDHLAWPPLCAVLEALYGHDDRGPLDKMAGRINNDKLIPLNAPLSFSVQEDGVGFE